MCHRATRARVKAGALAYAALAPVVWAQQSAPSVQPDWRRIGNSAIELELASPASGPVDRAWYSADGARLFIRTGDGRVFETADFEKWRPSAAVPPEAGTESPGSQPPSDARAVKASPANPSRLYAYGGSVFRSDDGGLSWSNVTEFESRSIIGGRMNDLAVSPADSEEIAVANEAGIWRSLDGGVSWTGLNESLPNLPARRIVALPRGAGGTRLLAGAAEIIEWAPGEKQAWRVVNDPSALQELARRRALSGTLGVEVTALAEAGDFLYAGSADGRLWSSSDKGRSWNPSAQAPGAGAVEAIYADAREPRLALAAVARAGAGRILRTVNAGQFWDDLTSDLPEGAAHGITADRATGTLYAATDRGLFTTRAELNGAGQATPWTAVAGLPVAHVLDARLDADGNQLFVAVEGYGVYAAMAPHRAGSFKLVNAADFSQRAAAPGSLLSVLGGRVRAARAGALNVPVLAASEAETQIQIPFGVRGGSLSLALETSGGSYRLAVPLEAVSPAIFVDRDGSPLVLNADTGVLLDAMNPARSNARLQILMTGLGRVRPDWPAGTPGPLQNSPEVVAPVRAYLDRAPVEVTRAVLAPGYIGLYLVEVQLPALINAGPAEFYIESEGRESNRVRVWMEP
ncbi:MAG: hypothetical protein ACM336_11935 [Acidobacteriota bacterium]